MTIEEAEQILCRDNSNVPEAVEVIRDKLREGYILFPAERVLNDINTQVDFSRECEDAESAQALGVAIGYIRQALADDGRLTGCAEN